MIAEPIQTPTFGGLSKEHYATNGGRPPTSFPPQISKPAHSTSLTDTSIIETSQPLMSTNYTIRQPRYLTPSTNMQNASYDDLQPHCVCFVNKNDKHTVDGLDQTSESVGLEWLNTQLRKHTFSFRNAAMLTYSTRVTESEVTTEFSQQPPWQQNLDDYDSGSLSPYNDSSKHDNAEGLISSLKLLNDWVFDGVIYTSELDQYRMNPYGVLTLNVSLYGPQFVRNQSDSVPNWLSQKIYAHRFDEKVRSGDRLFVGLHLMVVDAANYVVCFQYRLWSSRIWNVEIEKSLANSSHQSDAMAAMKMMVGAWYVGVVTDAHVVASNGMESPTKQLNVFVNPSWVNPQLLAARYSLSDQVKLTRLATGTPLAMAGQYLRSFSATGPSRLNLNEAAKNFFRLLGIDPTTASVEISQTATNFKDLAFSLLHNIDIDLNDIGSTPSTALTTRLQNRETINTAIMFAGRLLEKFQVLVQSKLTSDPSNTLLQDLDKEIATVKGIESRAEAAFQAFKDVVLLTDVGTELDVWNLFTDRDSYMDANVSLHPQVAATLLAILNPLVNKTHQLQKVMFKNFENDYSTIAKEMNTELKTDALLKSAYDANVSQNDVYVDLLAFITDMSTIESQIQTDVQYVKTELQQYFVRRGTDDTYLTNAIVKLIQIANDIVNTQKSFESLKARIPTDLRGRLPVQRQQVAKFNTLDNFQSQMNQLTTLVIDEYAKKLVEVFQAEIQTMDQDSIVKNTSSDYKSNLILKFFNELFTAVKSEFGSSPPTLVTQLTTELMKLKNGLDAEIDTYSNKRVQQLAVQPATAQPATAQPATAQPATTKPATTKPATGKGGRSGSKSGKQSVNMPLGANLLDADASTFFASAVNSSHLACASSTTATTEPIRRSIRRPTMPDTSNPKENDDDDDGFW